MKIPPSPALAEPCGHRRRLLAAAGAAALLPASMARAQTYPGRPVRVIVPFVTGGAIDVVARALAEPLQKAAGQSFVVENRTGASGNLGVEAVVRAPADGHTLLVGPDTNFTVNPLVFPRLGFDPVRDLVPVAQLARLVLVLAVHPSVPARTLGEFVALAKARPGELACGTPGAGTPHDIALKQLEQAAKTRVTAIPYKGGAPAVTDAAGGHLQAVVGGLNVVKPHASAGRLRMLAVMQARRSSLDPSVPPASDEMPGLDVGSWLALFAPSGTPEPVLAWLRVQATAAIGQEEIARRLAVQGIEPVVTQPADFAALIRTEQARNRKLVEAGVLKAE